MKAIKDLFSVERYLSPKKGTPLNERASLVQFFVEKTGKEAQQIAVRLSHYSIDQLYALKSSYSERLTRNGKETADKYFWAVSRTHKA